MRTVLVSLSLASMFFGCAREPEAASAAPEGEPAPEVSAAQAPPSISAAPRMGGAIVATGDAAVEVVANASGSVDAAVTGTAGEAVANADVTALQVTVQGESNARHDIALAWDAPRGLFHGKAAAGARLASGPIDVSCSLRGKAHKGRLDMLVALPSPRFGGRMLALGRYSAEIAPKVDGSVDVHVHDAAGVALTADSGLALKLRAMGKARALQDIALRWDASRACFTGKVDAGAELAGGPFELTARADGNVNLRGGVEAIALIAPPTIGGSMIATGDYSVEIAPQLDGQIDAIVRNSVGASVEGGVELEAHVRAGGELRPVKLTWDPALLRFRGKLEGDFKLEPGPIELSLVAQGRLRHGAIMAAAVVPSLDANVDLAAKADAKLDAKAKARLPKLKAKADANAKLAANVPKPNVNVKAGAKADAKASGSAQGAAKASAKQQAGVKLGGSLSGGLSIGAK